MTVLPLAGPLTDADAEISGLAWYGDDLLIMPQYPDFGDYAGEGDGRLFALSRADVLAALDGEAAPLTPVEIPLFAPDLRASIDGYEGFEAIAVVGNRVVFSIESETNDAIGGYLVTGRLAPDLSALTLDVDHPRPFIPTQSHVENMAEETLVVLGEQVFTIHEANGMGVNADPVAHTFTLDLAARGTVPFPEIEYRITDATDADSTGRFWVINYFYPGDAELHAARDPLADRFGRGATHRLASTVERLIELHYDGTAFRLTDTPPLQLELLNDQSRNCEGLARLDDRGFLVATDKFPSTMLGFVPRPQGP